MTIYTSILLILLLLPRLGQAQTGLEITVENIREVKGSLHVGLFKDSKDFPNKASEGKVITVTSSTMTVVFEGLAPGDYGLSVFHDENNNHVLDTNVIGIPKEGFGFGNNAMGMFGPPSFEKARVILKKDRVKHKISLRHF